MPPGPLVPARGSNRDKRSPFSSGSCHEPGPMARSNEPPSSRQLRSTMLRIDRHINDDDALYRRADREPAPATALELACIHRRRAHLPLSTLYIALTFDHLSTHHCISLLLPQNISHISPYRRRPRELSPSTQWRSNFFQGLGSTTSSSKR
jgi:hypothetical protein